MPAALEDLSPRERDVLQAIVAHASNAEIAARFVLSVRTVESHVASLLRKTGAANRHELAALGAPLIGAVADERSRLPEPPSTFVGRATEQAALEAALATNRLVTALGPGGVGKTRIALAVAKAARFPDGAVYADLVPVADPARVAAAIAQAAGVGAQQAASPEEALVAWLRGRRVLLVVDNCEHVVDGVAPLLERLLAETEGLTVLATSRTRLLVPFERVVPIPGLSVDRAAGAGDAVELFRLRAEAQGAELAAGDDRRIAAICDRLDGMALAIELAAARVPSIGLEGLESGLTAALDLLSGGRRTDERHRSLRATLDWSVALLEPGDRDVLFTLSVFAAPFDAAAAAALTGHPVGVAQAALARLADSSLLGPARGRFRMLEAVRQYGVDHLAAAGGLDDVRARHLAWSESTTVLGADFDLVGPEARAALAWAGPQPARRAAAFRLSGALAALAFAAGAPAEAQLWSEHAASLAPDAAAAITALRDAAGAAEARNVGLDALRLHRAAARIAEAAGDVVDAAIGLARVGVLVARAPGLMATQVPLEVGSAELDAAAALAGDDPRAAAHIEVGRALYVSPDEPGARERSAAAIALAARIGDPLLENVALDGITSILLANHDIAGALAASLRRTALLDDVPLAAAAAGIEFADSYNMTGECALAAGDLPAAQRWGERVRALPSYAREPHLKLSRILTFGFMVGDMRAVTEAAPLFLAGWDRAGRPRAGNLLISSQAAAAAFALAGDQQQAAEWRGLDAVIRSPHLDLSDSVAVTYLHALVDVHTGRFDAALPHLRPEPGAIDQWQNGMWRPWYAALRAEAAVLAGSEDAGARVSTARVHTRENPVAAALVDRAEAVLGGGDLAAIADRLDALGARYQAARTRLLAGDTATAHAAFADLGIAV